MPSLYDFFKDLSATGLFAIFFVIALSFYLLSRLVDGFVAKQCPYCAEKIKKKAIVCRFCDRDLTGSFVTTKIDNDKRNELYK
jgi:hypothetical protein